jgi:hypothetical protein
VNGDDPTARAELIERVGPDRYNDALRAHLESITVVTGSGHAIRPTNTRFGRLFVVGATGRAFPKQSDAEDFARQHPAA